MKKIVSLFAALLLTVFCVSICAASPYPYINDQADVLTEEQERALDEKLGSFSRENALDLVVVLASGIDTEYDRMTFADDYYDYNGYAEDGALLLVNLDALGCYTRGNSWLSTAGSCIDRITPEDISDIGAELTPLLLNGSYYEAVSLFPDLVGNVLQAHRTGNLGIMGLIALVVGFIGAFAYTGKLKKQLKSVSDAANANSYVVDHSLTVTRGYDHFLYATITKTKKESKSSSSHTSSSGSSHGGGGF